MRPSLAPPAAPWRARLRERLGASRLRFDVPLRPLTTLRIGGPADCLVDLESEEDLQALFQVIREAALPFLVLGKGSNVLVGDAGLRGVAIRLGRAFSGFRSAGAPGLVRAGAGLADAAFVEEARALGLGGMEFLVAIPGTIGGAIAMNAGAHSGETARFLTAARWFEMATGTIRDAPTADFAFAYRRSPLRAGEGCLVLEGAFRLEPTADAEIQARKAYFQAWRREHQPRDFPNCGSVFKNPPGQAAARLIDDAGLKGHRQGDAQVSEKHANFIVNRGQATARDVLELIDFIRDTIYKRTGHQLELELEVV
jgi:UDP-N-acetylmuramate dehydrogenase